MAPAVMVNVGELSERRDNENHKSNVARRILWPDHANRLRLLHDYVRKHTDYPDKFNTFRSKSNSRYWYFNYYTGINRFRKKAHTLVAQYPGRKEQQQQLTKKLNNWVWGNILIGGIIGLVIDIVSGSIDELHPKEVHFNFEEATISSSGNVPIVFADTLFERCNRHRLSRTYKTAA